MLDAQWLLLLVISDVLKFELLILCSGVTPPFVLLSKYK